MERTTIKIGLHPLELCLVLLRENDHQNGWYRREWFRQSKCNNANGMAEAIGTSGPQSVSSVECPTIRVLPQFASAQFRHVRQLP